MRRYHRQGFAVLPPISVALRRRLGARLDALLARAASLPPDLVTFERDLPARQRAAESIGAAGDAVFLLGDPCRLDPCFAQAFAHPSLLAAAQAVLGTADIHCHFTNATIKNAHVGSGIAWHRDAANRYMPTARAAFVRAMICLDGMDAANGGTAFRPGSHLAAPEGAEVVERCPPGAIVLIHPRVLHGGAPNRSARPRRNLIVQWGRADDPPLGEARESLTGLSPAEVLALGGG